jgi:hypothetical protein
MILGCRYRQRWLWRKIWVIFRLVGLTWRSIVMHREQWEYISVVLARSQCCPTSDSLETA